jgi:RimJ/RimL family protein N-acetyltransferase
MIQRTFDYRIVNRLKGNWRVIISSECFYLLETNGKEAEALGLWSLHKHEDGVMIHADMGPKCRGRKAIESAKSAFGWVFRNTDFKKIYAGIPKENKPACRVAAMAGMRFTGLNKDLRCFELSTG